MAQRSSVPPFDSDELDARTQPATLTHEESVVWFGHKVQDLLGISTEEFLRRWDPGECADLDEYGVGRKVNELVMSMGVVRPDVHGKPRPRPRG